MARMVACLSVLTSLKKLEIGFKYFQSRPDRNSLRLPPPTRTLLPVLNRLDFKGVSEYLEDLVARIDVPLLDSLAIIFFHQLIFNTPQLTQFRGRRAPMFKKLDAAHLNFCDYYRRPNVALRSRNSGPFHEQLTFKVSCDQSDWQLSFMTQMCSSSFPQGLISTVEALYIKEDNSAPWQDDIDGGQWLEVLQPFTAVKTLYVSEKFTPRIAPALRELVGERVTEVLPALQTLYFEESPVSGTLRDTIGLFVISREVVGHPVSISQWERKLFE